MQNGDSRANRQAERTRAAPLLSKVFEAVGLHQAASSEAADDSFVAAQFGADIFNPSNRCLRLQTRSSGAGMPPTSGGRHFGDLGGHNQPRPHHLAELEQGSTHTARIRPELSLIEAEKPHVHSRHIGFLGANLSTPGGLATGDLTHRSAAAK